MEKKGEKFDVDVHFEDALPTLTHLSLTKLVQKDIIKYIVSQNVDGLHLKSGLDRYWYFMLLFVIVIMFFGKLRL